MAKEDLYFVRRAFPGLANYGDLPGDTGMVTPLLGYRNDDKLVRLGFLEKVTGKPDVATCGECGARFLSGQYRDAHGDRRHNPRHDATAIVAAAPSSPMEQLSTYSATGIQGAIVDDLTGDAEERQAERDAPIYWEKTAASQKG